jgi:hypothetical protein
MAFVRSVVIDLGQLGCELLSRGQLGCDLGQLGCELLSVTY